MAEVVEDQLCTILKKAEFSLPFDEFTFPGYDSLLAYVRFVKEESLCQELLFSRLLETNSEGESIFNVVKSFIDKKDIPLNNIVACATDGAPSMTDCHRGFISYLKVSSPDIFTMLCVIYRHLVARNLRSRLHDFLNTVITAGNKISCSKLSPISTALLRKRRRLSKLAAPNRNEDMLVFCSHLTELQEDMERRFHDLFALRVPDWIVNPFIDIVEEESGELEEELITHQNDNELEPKFRKCDQES
ncbi:Hypothetical predicted protein [Octopus vulgaris]|uniref:Uncharacterized protein n=1 Tax=Octopus vulgaris TaxID=6645 RepID=A0AA36BMV4_OCTVU|nr:Hypothetical predicted protein [Octopus vulgaris]